MPPATIFERFGVLLTEGWFEVRTDREELVLRYLCRDFSPSGTSSIHGSAGDSASLRCAEGSDVDLRLKTARSGGGVDRGQLALLKQCARDRSGHAILVLSAFLLPALPLRYLTQIFWAGALIMYIDDHGDCYSDLTHKRATFMNQIAST